MAASRTANDCAFTCQLNSLGVYNTALYTTIYPGCEPYLQAWGQSVNQQSTQEFDVWIGVDALSVGSVENYLGLRQKVNWILFEPGCFPAQIRNAAFNLIVDAYNDVVFVDSDDILYSTRVETAVKCLKTYDIYGCALDLIDKNGKLLDRRFQYSGNGSYDEILPTTNIFGLSNTAYRCNVLKQLLPIPENCVIVDWYLAALGWLKRFKLHFDNQPLMAYRQYDANIARVIKPYTKKQVLRATELVLKHYALLLQNLPEDSDFRGRSIGNAAENVESFYQKMLSDDAIFNKYINALNELNKEHIWWDFVAAPEWEDLWEK